MDVIEVTRELGKGYTQTNLKYMRQFYIFSKSQTVSDLFEIRINLSQYCIVKMYYYSNNANKIR